MVLHRRHLHANPEVGLDLPRTHEYVANVLTSLGLTTEVIPGAGVSTRISGTNKDLTPIIFRADMDALQIIEDSDDEYRSTNQGAMHA